ncbi:MAG: c-type cytochrome [Pirellulales bacterium]|nr:c-type cytochrome [Pirellulales bacterium]
MRASEKTFRSLRRMHGLFWLSSVGLLAATAWMLLRDADRPWKHFQREYRESFSSNAPAGIRQIVLPELTFDLNFRRIARCDRCPTCHLGIEQTPSQDKLPDNPQPFRSHPRLDLFVGAGSPHPAQDYGCTVCHQGQGSATDFRRAAHAPNDSAAARSWKEKYAWSRNPDWDFPMLPARFAESRCLQCHRDVTDLEPTARFPDPPAAKLVAGYQLVRRLGCYGCHELENATEGNVGHWTGDTARKVGPSLRQVAQKTSFEFLADRIADPAHFLPDSRMPRLFGLAEHLEGSALADAKRFEAVEIRAIATYLLGASEPAAASEAPLSTATESPSAERGRKLFALQGCLACHNHDDFPQGQAVQGPDLSRVGAKYAAANAPRWLVDWLRDPARCAPQTSMPNPRLEKTIPANGGKTTDPALDLAAYLLASKGDFRTAPLPPFAEKDLDSLAALYSLQGDPSFSPEPTATAKRDDGVQSSTISTSTPNAVAVGSGLNERAEKKLRELGRLAIAKRGCFGCHEIAGFEQSQRIGPALGDWGRKPTSQLAFEKIDEFVAAQKANLPREDINLEALRERRREGFLMQKLRAPRSFDFRVAAKKQFNEYLRMGRFNLSDAEREAIATFVLGLTADSPQGKYAYRPDAKRTAIIEGRKVLDRYACAECHALEMERWTIAYKPGEMPRPPQPENFAFLEPRFSEKALAASRKAKESGFAQAEIAGMPRLDADGNILEDEDDEGRPIAYFTLWKPAAIDGRIWTVGGADVTVPLSQILKKRPAWGGTLARILYPAIAAVAKEKNFSSPELQVWGWLPPALVGEGGKVEPAWLAKYLSNPTTIRPAGVMPMPKFNLSEKESAALAEYFAAAAEDREDSLLSPKTQDLKPGTSRLAVSDERLDQAFRLMLDAGSFCAKCHLLGDYRPGGEGRAILAPNLADAGNRLRPRYLRRWLADPKSVLPYTPMPQIFPPVGDPQGQELLPGSSLEQLDAVAQLLLEYHEYAKSKLSIKKLMPPRPKDDKL